MTVRSETRPVSGFSKVLVQGYGEVTLVQGENEGLTIEAEEELLPKIKSEVSNGRLTLGFDLQWREWITWWFNSAATPNKTIRYTIEMKTVEQLLFEGSCTLEAERLSSEACELSVSGSARIKIRQADCRKLVTCISGSGNMSLAGKADAHDIHVNGSGEIEAEDLETQQSQIRISGSGRAQVNAAQKLSVEISGSASVSYRGQPQIQPRISGSGSIRAI